MKHITLCLILTFFVCGCNPPKPKEGSWWCVNGKIKVLTTLAMIHTIVQEIGGDRVDSIALIRSELDPHSYELVKGDDEKFAASDLLFYNGLGLEHGLSVHQNIARHPHAVAVADPLLSQHPEWILRVDGECDPHIWMDIALWVHIIDPIVEALAQADPEHADDFRARGALMRHKMEEADAHAYATLQAIAPHKRYLVTSHDAFHYFTRHYLAEAGEADWQKRCKAPEGLAPEAQMSVYDVMELIAHIEAFHIRVLFPESNVSQDALRKIVAASKEKGFTLRLCQEMLYGDSMGKATSYLEMMTHNVEVIAREMNNES